MVTYIVNLALPLDHPFRRITIRGYQAESYSEHPSQPKFDPASIQGRSSPLQFYDQGDARTISFSMLFHKDMILPSINYTAGAGLYQYPTINTYNDYSGKQGTQLADYIGLYLDNSQSLGIRELNPLEINKLAEDITWSAYEDFYGGRSVNDEKDSYTSANQWLAKVHSGEFDATYRFHQFINQLKALNYPEYTSTGIVPPKVFLRVGDGMTESTRLGSLQLKGFCTTEFKYTGEVKFNSLVAAEVQFTFTEVVDQSWSAQEVQGGMMRYVNFNNNGEWVERGDLPSELWYTTSHEQLAARGPLTLIDGYGSNTWEARGGRYATK